MTLKGTDFDFDPIFEQLFFFFGESVFDHTEASFGLKTGKTRAHKLLKIRGQNGHINCLKSGAQKGTYTFEKPGFAFFGKV